MDTNFLVCPVAVSEENALLRGLFKSSFRHDFLNIDKMLLPSSKLDYEVTSEIILIVLRNDLKASIPLDALSWPTTQNRQSDVALLRHSHS